MTIPNENNIVKRLREAAWYKRRNGDDKLMKEAADYIEKYQEISEYAARIKKELNIPTKKERND